MDEWTREDVLGIIDRFIEELLAAAEIRQPPVDTLHLAQEHLGMTICMDHGQPQRGRAQRNGGKRHIYLRPEPTEERHQWTVAHEIGEHYKLELLERLGADSEIVSRMTGESLANLFAYHLLAPACWFVDDAPAFDYDVLQLKERYRTASHEVVAWRLLDLPEPCVITVVDNDRVSRRRSNAWRVTRKLTPIEKQCQQNVNQDGQPSVMQDAGCRVHGWPVHKADWQREILRSVFEDVE